MSAANDGGPAFPSDPYIDHPAHGRVHKAQVGDQPYDGMSLRAYIATHALPAMIQRRGGGAGDPVERRQTAKYAVAYADALIAELLK